MPDQNWQFELEEYIKQGEPDRAEKSEAWQTAIGLQAVDGLNTSAYLLDTAKDHIEGKITIDEAQQRIHSYYEQRTTRTEIENETKEADIVSARIAKLLGEKTFQFSPAEWITIHRRLFEGVFDHAGQIRKYNISKKEWILNGETVIYADFNSIKDTLDYDFATEKQFSYEGLSVEASVKHLAKFASDIWQIHPFGEGNTRATAVFMIKYMKTFGFRVNNDAFRENSWYFRNALVRANYNILNGHDILIFAEQFGVIAVHLPKYILGQFFGKLCHIMIAIPSSWCGIELGVNGSLLKVRPNILFLNFIAPSFLARSLAGHLAAFE